MLTQLFGPKKVRLHVPAFVAASLLSPLIFGCSGVILAGYGILITAYAAFLGLPAMILLGLPLAYVAITRRPLQDGTASVGDITAAGFVANFLAFPLGVIVLIFPLMDLGAALSFMMFYCGCGLIAAPLQAAIFGVLYKAIAPKPELVIDAEVFA